MAFVRNSQNCCLGVGANNIAYIPDNMKPLFNYFGNGGIIPGLAGNKCGMAWPSFRWQQIEGPQFWVNPALPVIGLPGIVNGQLVGQPLIDTRSVAGTNGGF